MPNFNSLDDCSFDTLDNPGSFDFGWVRPPKSYPQELIDRKRGILSEICSGLSVLSEDICITETWPYVFIRATVDAGLRGWRKGVTLSIDARPKSDKVFVCGRKSYERERHLHGGYIVIDGNCIVTVDYDGSSLKYPVSSFLLGTFIPCGHYPHRAMPMTDAVELCKTYRAGTCVGDMYTMRKMLKSCKARWEAGFGG